MADFNEHIDQAKHNLTFLSHIGDINNNYWDWKVTTSFYISVHIINAHLAKSANQHYRSHNDVDKAINPYGKYNGTKLDEDSYTAYDTLSNLSRRARYLVSEKKNISSTDAFSTHDRHLAKALSHLNQIFLWFNRKYGTTFPKTEIFCPEIGEKLTYFKHKEQELVK